MSSAGPRLTMIGSTVQLLDAQSLDHAHLRHSLAVPVFWSPREQYVTKPRILVQDTYLTWFLKLLSSSM